ncbi:hypothetical protein [Vibrio phage XZ1]|uniref:Uncharacterized protein n=3 Tax=Schizotequatrovirus TaxID=1198137 RepID=A0A126HHI1_9CAUD|nr:hypothetical protein CF80_gp030 [Vibrio phage VH7D]YP_009201222.1 hypothetical protein AVU32_gp119 [Vibrio phage ValKK3]ALP47330.1 hypothetical protein phiGrn1_0253 [Vibrio phage phi-Grn1]ALP47713.1 hypothetical protein phiST2_0008 [Vibrio phage phi-ST2]QBX06330.1 hypothetical protein Va3_377 [Vibrio phage Va3]QNJ54573.1 hypothetical protein vBValMR10Z_32 [Vibrio phage vB_ValM_R10Z]QNJ54958.1 hypothetical protein vBValMR11Z_32 [Vibrio phage vB_ValM_R11Z]UOL51387.1 hypothetical protein [Vi
MIDNMIRDMIESEYEFDDIIHCLEKQYKMPHIEAVDALNEVINDM